MKEEILFLLKEQQAHLKPSKLLLKETLEKAADYIEFHSISKLDLLLEMQQMNTKEENVPAVKNLYEKFFREPKEEEHEEER